MRVDRLLSNLGYGSRREVTRWLEQGRVTRADGEMVGARDAVTHEELRFDGEPLDPPAPLTLLMHKPLGVTCSHNDVGPLVYDLLPERFARRQPPLSTIGRLDKETSGLLLLTDDGALLHRLTSPKKTVWKMYEAHLARPLSGGEGELFSSGTLMLDGETKPCRPARLEVLEPQLARLALTEGRYHQVRRMFAATGNEVVALHRIRMGSLTLQGLAPGEWRFATAEDIAAASATESES